MSESATQAQAMIEACYLDGEATINDRTYVFTNLTHKRRRKVFAFYSKVASGAQSGDMSFLDAPEFEPIEEVIYNVVTFEGSLLSRLGDTHWEKYAEDYIIFITTALGVISYPFLRGKRTG